MPRSFTILLRAEAVTVTNTADDNFIATREHRLLNNVLFTIGSALTDLLVILREYSTKYLYSNYSARLRE